MNWTKIFKFMMFIVPLFLVVQISNAEISLWWIILAEIILLAIISHISKINNNLLTLCLLACHVLFVYFYWKQGLVDKNIGSFSAIVLVVLMPLVIIGFFSKSSVLPSILTILAVTCWFVFYADTFWDFITPKSGTSEKIVKRPLEGHKSWCKNIDHDGVGYMRAPNCAHALKYLLNGDTVSINRITTDQNGWRNVPHKGDADMNLLFVGGSRTFGDGVSDDQTYPYYVSKLLHGDGKIWANSGWGLNQIVWLFANRKDELEYMTEKGQLIVFYHAIRGHIRRTSGAYINTMRYHKNYPKYKIDESGPSYLGRLRNYSFAKYWYMTWVYVYCRFNCQKTFDLGFSSEDYLDHLHFIVDTVVKLPNAKMVIVIHPGKYGRDLKKEISLSDEFVDSDNLFVIDATSAFELETPFVHHPNLDTHLSAVGNKTLAEYIVNKIPN